MATREITDLPVNATPDAADLLYNRQVGVDKSMTLGQVDTFVNDEIDNKSAATLVSDSDNLLIRVASASKKVLTRILKDYILGGVNRVVGNATGNIPLSNGVTNANLRAAIAGNADNSALLDSKSAGNASGNIPINNGTTNINLNSEIFNNTKTKEISLVWDMDTNQFKVVAHGLDWTKINLVGFYIIDNAVNQKIFAGYTDTLGIVQVTVYADPINITLLRVAGGLLDSPSWNNATLKITIFYDI